VTSSTPKSPDGGRASQPTDPSVREHGVDGYTDAAVGGFGENYGSQVAHGAESQALGSPSDSELDANPETGQASLEEAVRRTLARAHVDAADLRIEVLGTEVRLHGTVRHVSQKADLEARARAVPGVSSVVSELTALRASWEENT
jgi:osmotically-inducible protein OsmY